MNEWILRGYELAADLLPFVLVFILLWRGRARQGIKTGAGYVVGAFLLAFYLAAVFNITGVGTLYDLLRIGLEIHQGQVNLIPFSQSIDLTAYLLNVLMFIPFGFLFPYLCRGRFPFPAALAAGFAFSLLIELSQLLTHRATDVDDLLMNTLGAAVGGLVFLAFRALTKGRRRGHGPFRWDPALYTAAIFIGRFFLLNDFWAAGQLYGF